MSRFSRKSLDLAALAANGSGPPPASPQRAAACYRWLAWLSLSIVWFALDQLIKSCVSDLFAVGESQFVTRSFNLVHFHNPGAAFGFLADAGGWQRSFLIVVACAITLLLAHQLYRDSESRLRGAAYALILGGALGNVADRVRLGYVIDYLDLHWNGWHWPAFNVADVGITLGAVALLASIFLKR